MMVIEGVKKIVISFTGGIDATFGDMIAKGEKEKLNSSFKIYEGIYLTISTITFCSSMFLIVPFVEIYTNGVNDADYVRPIFAYIFVIAEFLYIIKQLYYDLVKVAGHFKQTKKGAYVEAILNVVISLILVLNFGLVGVAIGTLFAMLVRTIEIMYYTSKHILNRSVLYTFKRGIVIISEFIIITFIISLIPHIEVNGYKEWIMQAIIVTAVSAIVVILLNNFIYKDNVNKIIKIIRKKLKVRK